MKNNHRKAFTLVELLIVISIIAVLAAIAVPAVNNMIDSSQNTKCINNLRQIGTAALAYAAENDGRLPPINITATPAQWWPALIAPYLGTSTNRQPTIWRCPAVKNKQIITSNGNTHYGYGPCKPIMDFATSSRGGSLRLGQIPKPQKTWLFGDIGKPDGGIPKDNTPVSSYNTCGSIQRFYLDGNTPACRHSKGKLANVVFCDGHVESLPWSAFQEPNNPLFGYNTLTKSWDF